MPVSHAGLLKELERLVKRRVDAATRVPITVTDVVVYQINPNWRGRSSVGEFNPLVVENKNFDAAKAAKESSDSLLTRMSSHIETLAKHAMAGKDNKDPHHITRVILNEFSLYPHRDRGPLSLAEFNSLREKINEIAQRYPQNLHLLLASIPVKINQNEVVNLVMYVQCGEHPIIHTSTKARPSHVDPVYPNTQNRHYSSEYFKDTAALVFDDGGCSLYLMSPPMEESKHEVSDAAHLYLYRNVDDNSVFYYVKGKDDKEPQLQYLPDSFIFPGNAPFTSMKANPIPYNNRKITEAVLNITSKRDHTYTRDSKDEFFNLTYGGDILFRVGDTQVRTTIDICLDHFYGFGKARLANSITTVRGAGSEALPTQTSHVVTSNWIEISENKITSNTATHADPFLSHSKHSLYTASGPLSMLPSKRVDLPDPEFGSHTIMKIFPSRPLSPNLGELAKQVERHNEFIVKLQALYLYRENRPQEMDLVHAEIVKYILESFVRDLHLIITNPTLSSIERIIARNRLPDFEDEAFRKSSLSVMLDKIESMPDVYPETRQATSAASYLLRREFDTMTRLHEVGFDLRDRPELFLSPSDHEVLEAPEEKTKKRFQKLKEYQSNLKDLFDNYKQESMNNQDDTQALFTIHESCQKTLASISAKAAHLKDYLDISDKSVADEVKAVQDLSRSLEDVKSIISEGYKIAKTQTPLIRRTNSFLSQLSLLTIKQEKCSEREKKAISDFLTDCKEYKDTIGDALKKTGERKVVLAVQQLMKFIEQQKNINLTRKGGSGLFQPRHLNLGNYFKDVEKLYQTTAQKQIESFLPRRRRQARPAR
jgi:hypothetical protein